MSEMRLWMRDMLVLFRDESEKDVRAVFTDCESAVLLMLSANNVLTLIPGHVMGDEFIQNITTDKEISVLLDGDTVARLYPGEWNKWQAVKLVHESLNMRVRI